MCRVPIGWIGFLWDLIAISASYAVSLLCFAMGGSLGTGYLSILPVDQGVEHSAGASFAPNPAYFDPENIVRLAIEGGCNAVASTLGVLGLVARKYAHKIPFLLKLNHNELLSYPNQYDQTLFATVRQAYEMGCVAVGATIYFGSAESRRQIQEVSRAFAEAHELGMATVLWCYLRNSAFKTAKGDFHEAADLTGQADHLGATIGADIVKQKLATNNGGFETLNYSKWDKKIYSELSHQPIRSICVATRSSMAIRADWSDQFRRSFWSGRSRTSRGNCGDQ